MKASICRFSNARFRDRIKAVDDALAELRERGTISLCEKESLRDPPGRKIFDAKYTLYPSAEFIQDVKAANKRKRVLQQAATEQGLIRPPESVILTRTR